MCLTCLLFCVRYDPTLDDFVHPGRRLLGVGLRPPAPGRTRLQALYPTLAASDVPNITVLSGWKYGMALDGRVGGLAIGGMNGPKLLLGVVG